MSLKNVSIKEILNLKWSERFYFESDGSSYTFGNPKSFMQNDNNTADITFDISNNKVLANMDVNGALKGVTIFRETYRVNEKPEYWPGVWLHKDFSAFGPYSFEIYINKQKCDFKGCKIKTGFLDNIFPVTIIESESLKVTYLCCTPISSDGSEVHRGVIYGVNVQNISDSMINIKTVLPKPFQDRNLFDSKIVWSAFRGDDFEISLLDSENDVFEVDSNLMPDQNIWIPVAIYAPGDEFVTRISEKGSAYWINETRSYYRNMLGNIRIEDDAIYGEFLERNIISSFQAISMDKSGKISGSNWGTNPTHFAIWIKDMYYSLLPVGMFNTDLFKKAILWFEEYGVRHPGHILKGGVSHSLSVSLTALIFSGIYYTNTGDKKFFLDNIHLVDFFEYLAGNMLDDRIDKTKYLFTTHFLSDGETYADWHTGTNICAYIALKYLSLLMKEVYNRLDKAELFDKIAEKTRDDIEKYCIILSRYGEHYNEGVYVDTTKQVRQWSDGEESDTTLMAYYGYCSNDTEKYSNYMKFSMSEENLGYCPESKCIRWIARPNDNSNGIPATMPGYMKGLGIISTNQEFRNENGYLWNIIKIADADGALWWWPYSEGPDFEIDKPRRAVIGKAGWGTGVFSVLFIERFLGLAYNAINASLTINPKALSSYSWKNFKIGNSRFSVEYSSKNGMESYFVENHNSHKITVRIKNKEFTVSAGSSLKI